MIILPDRNIPRAKFLLPIPMCDWRTPSQAQPKNMFGHENQTRFCATARLHDGHIVWRGWFDDRDDFDAFIWAMADGSLGTDHYVQRLPTPWWNPDLREYGEGLAYEFITTVFITSGTTWAIPADCTGVSGQSGEFIDAIAGGGSGATAGVSGFGRTTTGGGGAAWSRIVSRALTPSGSAFIQVGAGGAGTSSSSSSTAGNAGTDSWLNAVANAAPTLATDGVLAKAGGGGVAGTTSTARAGGTGGLASASVGASKNNGGNGGDCPGNVANGGSGSGAGGAGGPTGAGNNGVTVAANGGTAGGSGDAGSGGAGGAVNGAGGNGAEYDASHGSGGGGGGRLSSTSGLSGGAAGLYGAGSGAHDTTSAGTALSVVGGVGLLVVAYAAAAGGARSFGVIIH